MKKIFAVLGMLGLVSVMYFCNIGQSNATGFSNGQFIVVTGTITQHGQLLDLDYANAGHLGFAGTGIANTFDLTQTITYGLAVSTIVASGNIKGASATIVGTVAGADATLTYGLGTSTVVASGLIKGGSVTAVGTVTGVTLAGGDGSLTYGLATSTVVASGDSKAATLTATTKVLTPKVDLNTAFEVGVATPTAVGQLMRNAAFVLYIGTGTSNAYDWVKVGGQ
jgi:hypothetical protein